MHGSAGTIRKAGVASGSTTMRMSASTSTSSQQVLLGRTLAATVLRMSASRPLTNSSRVGVLVTASTGVAHPGEVRKERKKGDGKKLLLVESWHFFSAMPEPRTIFAF